MPEPTCVSTESPRVLVVEDVDDARKLLTIALSRLGCEVLNAEDGAEAISHLALSIKAQPIDLAIVDIAMQHVDGLAFVRVLRFMEQNELFKRRPRVKLYTAFAEAFSNEGLIQQLDVSRDDCYLKPEDSLRLLEDVNKLFGRSKDESGKEKTSQ